MQESLPRARVPSTSWAAVRQTISNSFWTELALPTQLALCCIALILVAAAGWEMMDEFQLTPVLLCLFSAIFLALFLDFWVAVAHSLCSALVANYFFVGPVGHIAVDVHFGMRLLVFSASSALVNSLVGRLRRAYVQSNEARAASELANREKDDILAILSHDLRAPLTAAQLSLQLIQRQLPPNDHVADIQRHADRAREALRRVNALVLDLLDSSKAGAGGLSLHREPRDVAAISRAVLEELRPVAAQAGVALESAGTEESLVVPCDGARISQLVSNLLGNALKFTPPGGRVRLGLRRTGAEVELSVSDTGVGMTADQSAHIFERFWQAERANRTGVGLGLYIVKAIVDAHGGRIRVESAPNQGTSFTVSFPA
jgi:signal transduction histidine kinase